MTYKQDFIDENPYLTYASKADSAYDGEGGGGGGYTLPVASADTLGGVKVGSGLSINEGGVLSENAFVITGTMSGSNGNYTITDVSKTLNEIYSAIDNGLIPVFIASTVIGGIVYFHLNMLAKQDNVPTFIIFSRSMHSMATEQANTLETFNISGAIADNRDVWQVQYCVNTLQNQ